MHTIYVIGAGLVLLVVFILAGRQLGGGRTAAAARAALWFIPFWAAAAAFNLSIGVRHGYTVSEELPIALIVFGVPTICAAVFWWQFSRGA
jgi:hypothetical protein